MLDLDFYALTETCLDASMKLVIKHKGIVQEIKASAFDSLLCNVNVDEPLYLEGYEILSGSEFVPLINVVRHKASGKKMLKITSNAGELKVTEDHRVSIRFSDGVDDLYAIDLKVGMYLLPAIDISALLSYNEDDYMITNIEECDSTSDFVYDCETGNNHFSANGFYVHNCAQIPLDKLFKGGFSTGHGYLREPNSIQSYSALACIAIQSNQNDQHLKTA